MEIGWCWAPETSEACTAVLQFTSKESDDKEIKTLCSEWAEQANKETRTGWHGQCATWTPDQAGDFPIGTGHQSQLTNSSTRVFLPKQFFMHQY
jgi:hypothetical protein